MRAQLFDALSRLSHDHFLSGEALAEVLDLSRASVSQLMKEARSLGVEVHSVHGRGYRLAAPLDWLDAGAVSAQLIGSAQRWPVDVLTVTDSTNSQLLARRDAPHGLTLAAECQTAGRGRRGRTWLSAPGGSLTFSVLLRFPFGLARLAGLSLAVGVALTRSLERLGLPAQLKWPNDVLLHGRKLAGILIETQGDTLGPLDVVVGVGLNVRLSPALLAEVDQPVADLAGGLPQPPSRNALLAMLLNELADVTDMFTQHGFAPFQDEWQRRHAFQDQAVVLRQPDGGAFHGIARGVDRDGALRLETPSGIDTVYAGDLSLRGAP